MNVVYTFSFGNSLKTWDKSGSLEREFFYFEKFFSKYETKFTLITYGDEEDKKYIENKEYITVIPLYEYFKKSDYKIITFIQSCIFPFKIKNRLKHVDVIKQNQLHGSWVSILLKLIVKKPLYTRTGFDIYIFSKNEKKKIYKRFGFYILTQINLLISNLYSVTSYSDFDFIKQKYFVNKSNFVYRPNWVLIRDSNNLQEHTVSKTLLSVGRLEKQKNYEFLIKALEGTGFALNIIGSGSKKNILLQLAAKHNVDLKIIDNQNYFDLLEIMKKYKFFILPSNFEGNPKVLLEAMSFGMVCLVSNISNHKEIITNKKNGFIFDHESVESVRESLKELTNTDTCIKISEKAFDKVKSDFSISNLMNVEYQDYKKLIL